MKRLTIAIAAVWLLALALPTAAEDAAIATPQPDQPEIPVVKIVLHPAAEARPALKYQLLPPFAERKPGNAALLYDRIPAEKTVIFSDNELIDKIDELRKAPLADLRRDDVRRMIPMDVVRETIRAAHCEYCDWQLPIREQPFWQVLLPDLQQTRNYGRFLAGYARVQIAEGKYDEAILVIQAGYALARHVATGQTLVHGLVGKAIAEVMSEQLRELIQQPDAPNLYWALSSLPRPLIDFRPGLEGEFDSIFLSYPKLRDVETKTMSADEARLLLEESTYEWSEMAKYLSIDAKTPAARLGVLAIVIGDYPRAKSYLIASGMPSDKVEAMPAAQVTLLAIVRRYREARDDLFKWLFSSDTGAIAGVPRSNREFWQKMRNREMCFSLESIFLPGVGNIVVAQVTGSREIAALQTLEALRIYAAAHHGQLPERLSDITEVPVPLDPTQDKPFFYHSEGDTATLESPNPPNSPLEKYLKYEIRMVPKDK
jgi:hypothetical protein